MPDQCLFCGSGRVTREHVISQSLSRRLWEVSPFTPQHGAPIEPKPGATRFHTNRLIDIVVNAACNDCNSKFFNALQSPCEGFLRSALAGERSILDSDLKKALASWLYKTALLVPLAMGPRTDWPQLLIDECKAFYIRRRPPVGTRVWIGRYDLRDNFPELVARADVSELKYRRRGRDFAGYQILVSIGYFVGIVIVWSGQLPDDVNMANRTGDRLLEIWPVSVGHIDWPPEHTFAYEELTGLSNMVPATP
jgi:hypothetical protein